LKVALHYVERGGRDTRYTKLTVIADMLSKHCCAALVNVFVG